MGIVSNLWSYIVGDSGMPLRNFLCTAFGAVVMLLFGLTKEMPSTIGKIKVLLPGKSDEVYERIDFAVLWVAGTLLAWFLYKPTDVQQSTIAGLTWVGALKTIPAISKKVSKPKARNL